MRRWKAKALKFYRKDPHTIKDFHSVYLNPDEFGELAKYLQDKIPLAGNTKQPIRDDPAEYTCMIEGGLFTDGKLQEVYQIVIEPVPDQMRWVSLSISFADANYTPIKKELSCRFRLPYSTRMNIIIKMIKDKIKANPAFEWEMEDAQ